MAEDFVELGLEGFDKVTDKYFERGYDKAKRRDKGSQKMNTNQRYASPPPAHRGYDDDRYNEYDDEEPRGPKKYRENGDRNRYEPSDYQPRTYRPYDQPRYPNERIPGYDDPFAPPSSREHVAQYATAGASGGALAAKPKKRYDYDDGRRHSPSRRRSTSRRRSYSSSSSSSQRSRSRADSRDRSRSGKSFRDSPALAFDKSEIGIGAGIAGALIGGYLGRTVGDGKKRGTALGAIAGGIGANILEHRWKIYQDEKKEKDRGSEEQSSRKQYSSYQDGGGRRGRSR